MNSRNMELKGTFAVSIGSQKAIILSRRTLVFAYGLSSSILFRDSSAKGYSTVNS